MFTVFVFLRRTRPTLIVATAIPVSLIATFGLVWSFGYTLNTMTLLGMTLAVGVVIDDAIVVLENIERHREAGESARRRRAASGTREIAFAATAATFSVAAVFLPVVFVEGLVGSFLRDFGLTVAGSVLISLFVALTLTPMLAARMPPPSARAHGSIYHRLERGFAGIETALPAAARLDARAPRAHGRRSRSASLRRSRSCSARGSDASSSRPPTRASSSRASRRRPAPSLDATLEYLERDEAWFLAQPELVGPLLGGGLGGGGNEAARHAETNMGMIFGTLKPRDERERSVMELVRDARARARRRSRAARSASSTRAR